MNILICGADGFLGAAIAAALQARGHTVLRGVHRPRLPGDVTVDYRRDLAPDDWLPRLAGVDAVVNAVGILREREPDDFDRIHCRAPAALFRACALAGIRRVVQISALGAAPTDYLRSKHAADQVLLTESAQGVVLRPSLIFGENGTSTRFFLMLASLPIHFIPGGTGRLQPVHVDDVAAAVARLLEIDTPAERIVPLVGPRRLSYAEWLAGYRAGMGLAPAWRIPLPAGLMTLTARLAGLVPASLLCADTWTMLRADNTADPAPAEKLLQRPLRAPEDFIPLESNELPRLRALAAWRGPLLRGVLTLLWLISAAVSLGIYPLADSLALLAAFDLHGGMTLTVLVGAAGLDLAMAAATLLRPGRRLWLAQIALICVYSVLVIWRLPEFLLHPFAPIVKNLAVLALLAQLWAEEK